MKYLGVITANPNEYKERYGDSLKIHTELPQYVLDIETPDEIGSLASDFKEPMYDLEGQIEGFQYFNLDDEGLGEYR